MRRNPLLYVCLSAGLMVLPALAQAYPHTIFAQRPGTTADIQADGTIPAAVVGVILSNSPDACEDMRTGHLRPNRAYLLTLFWVTDPAAETLDGCYVVGGKPETDPINPACAKPRGYLVGRQVLTDNNGSTTGTDETTLLRGGHVVVDSITSSAGGVATLKGFANVRVGQTTVTGGIIQADYCPELVGALSPAR